MSILNYDIHETRSDIIQSSHSSRVEILRTFIVSRFIERCVLSRHVKHSVKLHIQISVDVVHSVCETGVRFGILEEAQPNQRPN